MVCGVSVDTDDVNVAASTIDDWFEGPPVGNTTKVANPTTDPVAGVLSKVLEDTVTIACATADAVIEYKLSTSNVWVTYAAPIATTAWAVGPLVLNIRATKANMLPAAINVAYNVTV